MRRSRSLFVAVGLFYSCVTASAQSPNDMIGIFGNLLRSAQSQALRAEWEKLPPSEIACVDESLRKRNESLQTAILRKITPFDPIIQDVRAACQTAVRKISVPSSTPLDAGAIYYVANTKEPDPFLSLRTEPSKDAGRRIMKLRNGTGLQVLQRQSDDWWYVKVVSSGEQGWALSGIGATRWIICCVEKQADGTAAKTSAQPTYWTLDGSIVYLIASGSDRKFYYQTPNQEKKSAGATRGSLLFSGKATNALSYEGTVYVFNQPCKTVQYKAAGPILDGYSRVVIEGEEPLNDTDCHGISSKHSRLEFALLKPQPLFDETPAQTTEPQLAPRPGQKLAGQLTAQEQAADGVREAEAALASINAAIAGLTADADRLRMVSSPRSRSYNDLSLALTERARVRPELTRLRDELARAQNRQAGAELALRNAHAAVARVKNEETEQRRKEEAEETARRRQIEIEEAKEREIRAGEVARTKEIDDAKAAGANSDAEVQSAIKKTRDKVYDQSNEAFHRKDYALFRELGERLRIVGDVRGDSVLGASYLFGLGIDPDMKKGVDLLRNAANQEWAPAMNNLGLAYLRGLGVAKDDSMFVSLFKKAAEKGYAPAQANIGWAYLNGRGVERDHAQAVSWFKKAAAQGDPFGQYNLGNAYARGLGVPRDDEMAGSWLTRAADQGNAEARKSLAEIMARRKVKENGVQYAAQSQTTWTLRTSKNEMTDREDVVVQSVQKSDLGAASTIEGKCQEPGIVTFTALFAVAEREEPFNFPNYNASEKILPATRRINDEPAGNVVLTNDAFRNKLFILVLLDKSDASKDGPPLASGEEKIKSLLKIVAAVQLGLTNPQPIDSTWRALVQIETSKGTFLIRIPTFDTNVRKMIDSCRNTKSSAQR